VTMGVGADWSFFLKRLTTPSTTRIGIHMGDNARVKASSTASSAASRMDLDNKPTALTLRGAGADFALLCRLIA